MRIALLLLFHLVSQALGEDGDEEKIGVDGGEEGESGEVIRRNSYKQLHRRLFSNRRRSRFGVNFFRKDVEVPVMLMESTTQLAPIEEEEEERDEMENLTGNPRIFSISRFSIFRTTTEKPKPKNVTKRSKIIITTTKKPKKKFPRKNLFPKLQLGPSNVENDNMDESHNKMEEVTEQSTKVTKIKDPFAEQSDDLENDASKEKKSILHALFCIRKQTARRHTFFKSRSKSKSKSSEENKVDKSKNSFGDNRLSKALKKSIHRARVRDHISKKLKLSQRQFQKFLASALSNSEDDLSPEGSPSSNLPRRARSDEGDTNRNQSDDTDI